MDATLPFLILYACLSVLLFLWDAKHGLLPDRFTCPLLWSGLLFSQVCNPDGVADALWGAIIGYGTFAVIYWGYRILRHKEGLGYGDVKFLAALGAWHTWTFLPRLVFLAASFACGAVVVGLLMRGKESLKNPLPFGPFLAAAGFVVGWDSLLAGR
ncbi:prepilin peptidase [Shigella dysenteriae]|uniref:prepilin peptidase n=1 Tax=Shigella dysenteriae TaxID=622 RepID=UPI000E5CA9CD|nr:A24 family peptidase [Shigella dysenteriae]RIH44189.1 prepilin peptidase [Shigella dysenteriae]WNT68829.1 A24 family peptidase [Shigella dysenteriae]